jgi:hypothetical protein
MQTAREGNESIFETHSRQLNYGATIYISLNQDDKEFYISADGFSKVKLRLRTKEHLHMTSNTLSGLFKIYPPFFGGEYQKAKNKYLKQDIDNNALELKKKGWNVIADKRLNKFSPFIRK